MTAVQTQTEGLRRTFHVVVPAKDLHERLDAKIQEAQPRMQLKGFRPGKAPLSHLRKMYGPSIMRDLINEEVKRSTEEALGETRIASQPQLSMESDMSKVESGEADLAFKLEVDLMPEFEPMDPSSVSVEKLVAPVTDAEVDETLESIAKSNRSYEDKDGAAEDGDMLVIDFVGKIDGEAFEGGSAEGANLVLGSGRFIPGFEEQLKGAKAGEERVLNVSFPEDYPAEALKGKDATFETKVQKVQGPVERVIDDELAKQMGFEDVAGLREAVRGRLEQDRAQMARTRMKRALFDQMNEAHDFELPRGMVESEFAVIWRDVEQEKAAGRLDEEDSAKTEDELRASYMAIAERRVRLGLVLAEIGTRNKVEVRREDLAAAIEAQARQFPGQERQVVEFYQSNPNAIAQIRAPLYEEKVVDFILELAKVTTKEVTKEELAKAMEEFGAQAG